jgi:hypothetical protein
MISHSHDWIIIPGQHTRPVYSKRDEVPVECTTNHSVSAQSSGVGYFIERRIAQISSLLAFRGTNRLVSQSIKFYFISLPHRYNSAS